MRLIGLAPFACTVVQGADAEETNHVLQSFGLRRKLFGGAGELLCSRSVPLRDQANLADRTVDLADAGALLSRRRGTFLYQVRGLLNRGDQFGQQSARAFRDLHIRSGQPANLFVLMAAALRFSAYFAINQRDS